MAQRGIVRALPPPSLSPEVPGAVWRSPVVAGVAYPIWPLGFFVNTSGASGWQNVVWYWFYLPVQRRLSALTCEVTVAGSAGSTLWMGVHTWVRPQYAFGNLVASAQVSQASTGVKTGVVSSILPPGHYAVWSRTGVGGVTLRFPTGYQIPDAAGSTSVLSGKLSLSGGNWPDDNNPVPSGWISAGFVNGGAGQGQTVALTLA